MISTVCPGQSTPRFSIPELFLQDGYLDQIGGPENKKFRIKRFRQLLFDMHSKPLRQQNNIFGRNLKIGCLHHIVNRLAISLFQEKNLLIISTGIHCYK